MKQWAMVRRVFSMAGLFVLLTAAAGNAAAATYYSSPAGSGTTCSSASPCSLATGLGKLAAGNTLLLKDGIYYSGITVGVSGTSGNPVTIKAENDGGAIVDGQSQRQTLVILGKSYIDVEGIVFRNSVYDVVKVSGGSSYVNLRRLSAYNSGVGNYHLFLVWNSNNVLVEDCAASQTKGTNKAGRYCFISHAGAHDNTFRRNYCKYYNHTGGGGPCAAGADYGGSYDLWENNVFDVSEMPAGCSNVNYQFAIFGEGLYNDTSHNQWYGNVSIGGPNTVKGVLGESDVAISISNWELVNNVFINGQAGISNIGASKGAGWIVQNNTVVNIQSNSMTQTLGSGATAAATNNSFLAGSLGLSAVSSSSITSKYNNFSSVNSLYNSNVLNKTGDKQISPFYDAATYGYGAYLIVPQSLQGQGESGADIGAEVLYKYQDGVLTNQPLWPWPMESRIISELNESVTYEANGGIWKSLSGVYVNSPVTPPASDTTPPLAPTGTTASAVSSTQINLSWTASTDNVGVAGYRVYRNGTQIATTTTKSYSNTGLAASTTYSYTVAAYDAAGNVSAKSPQVSVTTRAATATTAPDTQAPTVPVGLKAMVVSSSQINLSWTASTDNVGVAGYRIYRGGTQIATTTGATYSNTGLTASTTYTYTVAAYDAAGNVSAQSTAASATITATISAVSVIDACTATLSSDFKNLHIPAAILDGSYLWGDATCETAVNGTIYCRVTNYGDANPNYFRNCRAGWISSDLSTMHLPSVLYESQNYWGDLQFVPTTDGSIWLMVTAYGQI